MIISLKTKDGTNVKIDAKIGSALSEMPPENVKQNPVFIQMRRAIFRAMMQANGVIDLCREFGKPATEIARPLWDQASLDAYATFEAHAGALNLLTRELV